MINSIICELLDIKYPLIQGGMAWIADANLAAAVSNAGGLGLISSINSSIDAIRSEIHKCKELTNKPFGVNIMLMHPNAAEVAQLVVEENVKVVTTGAGSPATYMPMWKEAGIKVIPVVASTAYAKKMADLGATALIAEGAESGGHVGSLHSMALIPQIVESVDLPVIAAGGIYDGRSAAAAFMLGACGVQMGTRFLVAEECLVHQTYKDKLVQASDISTIVTGQTIGDAVRCLKNPFSKQFYKMELDPNSSKEDLQKLGIGSLRKAVFEGDFKGGSFLAGEISGLIKKIEPAASIVEDVMNGTENLLKNAAQLIKQ